VGALAYYTVFSMAPLLGVIISLYGLFLGQELPSERFIISWLVLWVKKLHCSFSRLPMDRLVELFLPLRDGNGEVFPEKLYAGIREELTRLRLEA